MRNCKTRATRMLVTAAGAAMSLVLPAAALQAADQAGQGVDTAPAEAVSVPMHVGEGTPPAPRRALTPPSERFGFDATQAMRYRMFDPVDEAALRFEDEQDLANGIGKLRVGVVRDFAAPLSVLDAGWQEIAQGRVWTAAVLSAEAQAMRLHFSAVDLPKGAELWVYAANGEGTPEVFYADHGPHARSDFWSRVQPGDIMHIEYFVPAEVDETGFFRVDQAVHNYRGPNDFADDGDDDARGRDCHLDVMCYPAYHPLHNATVKIEYVDGGGYLCSATLINNESNDETPYIMTADHCINNDSAAASIDFRWFYQTQECDGANAVTFSASTGDLLWSRSSMDASLVMALGELPDGVVWAGWDTDTVANGTDLVGIHHPGGARKKASFGDRISHPWNDPYDYHGITWNAGTIEGGSSGSGLYRAGNQSYVGICSHSAVPLGCSNPDGPSGYGRFDRAYPYIENFMIAGPDDTYDSFGSSNDTCAEGTIVAAGVYNDLIVKSTDEDWYSIVVNVDEQLTVTLDFTDRYGNIDMKLYDACGGEVVASSETTQNDETLTYPNGTGEIQFFKLHVYLSSDTRNAYNMTIESDVYDPPLTHELVEVPISPDAIAEDPALQNAQSFDLRAVVDAGDDWTSTDGSASVDGEFYQHPLLDGDVPQGQLWSLYPALEFDSYFAAPDFTAPGFAEGPFVTNNNMSAIWFDVNDTGAGVFTIARFTVTSGTQLTVSGTSTAQSTQGELWPFTVQAPIDIDADCEGDLNGDGLRDQSDLGLLLAAYEVDGGGDIDGDGDTDQSDLGLLLAVYGVPCP